MNAPLLPVGTRIYDVHNPELTGRVKAHEYAAPGRLSAAPYLIEWDDCHLAHEVRGWFFVYSNADGIAALATGDAS